MAHNNKTAGDGVVIRRGWNNGSQGQSFTSSFCWQESGERAENLPKVVPSACVIQLPNEAGMPAPASGIFRTGGDKVLGDVLQKTFAGAAHGAISELPHLGIF